MALVPLLQIFSTGLRPDRRQGSHDVIPIIPEQSYMPGLDRAHDLRACRSRSSCCTTSSRRSRARSSRRRGSTARATARSSCAIVLPLSVPDPRLVRDLPVPLGLERPARRADLLGRHADVAPLTQRLAELTGTRGQEWQRLTAAAFISIVVPLIVFFSPAALLRARPAGRSHEGVVRPRRAGGDGCRGRGLAASALSGAGQFIRVPPITRSANATPHGASAPAMRVAPAA